MGWRETIARRRRKEEIEDARYPSHMRTAGNSRDAKASAFILAGPLILALAFAVYQMWVNRSYVALAVAGLMVLAAGAFAWVNMRGHRSRNVRQLREEREAKAEVSGVRWEE